MKASFSWKVAPASHELADFDGVKDPEQTARVSSTVFSSRRKSTEPRFQGQSNAKKTEARTFRALSQLHYYHALLATIVVCTLLMLVVGVSYAANERTADANPVLQTAIRGLIVGNRDLGLIHTRPDVPCERTGDRPRRLSPALLSCCLYH